MKATTLLEKQHRKVEGIFKKLESGRSAAEPLLRELSDDLAAHMAIEQNIFYPAVRATKADLVAESYEEHALAELSLKRLRATNTTNPTFKAKVTTLKELIQHHVEEEEEDLFPAVEKALGDEKLEALGKEMKVAFEAALAQGFEALVPPTFSKTSADASVSNNGNRASRQAERAGNSREVAAVRTR